MDLVDFLGKLILVEFLFRSLTFHVPLLFWANKFILMSVVSRRNVFFFDKLRMYFDSFKHSLQYFLITARYYEIPPILVCSETFCDWRKECEISQLFCIAFCPFSLNYKWKKSPTCDFKKYFWLYLACFLLVKEIWMQYLSWLKMNGMYLKKYEISTARVIFPRHRLTALVISQGTWHNFNTYWPLFLTTFDWIPSCSPIQFGLASSQIIVKIMIN